MREHRPLSISASGIARTQLVAHRGHAQVRPENTLVALRDAVAHGATHLEFDLQLTRDGVPVLLHDATLARTADAAETRDARRLTLDELRAVSVHEPRRFGARFAPTPVDTLAAVLDWADAVADLHLYPEIKVESFATHGREATVAAMLAPLDAWRGRCTVLSFDAAALELARAAGHRIGWCPPDASEAARGVAIALAPECLFGDVADFLGDAPLWPGAWDWVLYEVADAATARRALAQGATRLETMRVAELAAALAESP